MKVQKDPAGMSPGGAPGLTDREQFLRLGSRGSVGKLWV
jgi:hypothetical protein